MLERLSSQHVVLLGVGHTNAHVVRMWGMHPIQDTDLTCISDHAIATYSGMLPAALAGQVARQEMEIDLVRLCASVGARLITDPVVGIDVDQQQVQFRNRPAIPFDVLSIGIGSVPNTGDVEIDGPSVLKIKPMQTFLERLAQATRRREASAAMPLHIVVVGSGVAGIEISLCLPPFLAQQGVAHYRLEIVTSSEQIVSELHPSARRRILQELAQRSVEIHCGQAVHRVDSESVQLADGSRLPADIVIWATGASPPALLGQLGLPLDRRGFLATDRSLRSTAGHPIFAVGDSGSILDEQLPKAGVYAVRQGPVLWGNLQRVLLRQPLEDYHPQRSFLKLINMGDGRAIGQWRSWSFAGRWVMRWKNRIDSQFLHKYRPAAMHQAAEAMQCRGCGCKLGSQVLHAALSASDNAFAPGDAGHAASHGAPQHAALQLEDAADLGLADGQRLVASTDFFSSPTQDAYLSGRIAALHAASDIVASGARPTHALANIVLPAGSPASHRRAVRDFLAGARQEFAPMGAQIVGGHTIVGPRLEVGFTVVGRSYGEGLLRKSALQPGDQLLLTKPLGIGVLLAAHMRSQCPARHYESLLQAMLEGQHPLAEIATSQQVAACTDITGFGLAGHLLEMLTASRLTATLNLPAIPILPGAREAVRQGIDSSLLEDNLVADSQIEAPPAVRQLPEFRLLFDPQTCGGLLFGCPAVLAARFIELVVAAGLRPPCLIGQVFPEAANTKPLTVQAQ